MQSFALTPLGATRVAALRPLTEPRAARAALGATSECVRYLESNSPLALQAPPDLERALTALAVEAQALEPAQLLGIADFLTSLQHIRRSVGTATGGPFPALRIVLEGCLPFEREVKEIRAAIDPADGVVDDASPDLRIIRGRLRKQRTRLRGTLDSYLRGAENRKVPAGSGGRGAQRPIRTCREVRTPTRHSRDRFTVALAAVQACFSNLSVLLKSNNDIVALEQNEHREIHRILLALANLLRRRALDLRTTLAAATELDVVQARATFSRLIDGSSPACPPTAVSSSSKHVTHCSSQQFGSDSVPPARPARRNPS